MHDFEKFWLIREQDPSDVSGTGTVAEGVQFTDGSVAVRWLPTGRAGIRPTTVLHESMKSVVALHSRNGVTQVLFEDGSILGSYRD